MSINSKLENSLLEIVKTNSKYVKIANIYISLALLHDSYICKLQNG